MLLRLDLHLIRTKQFYGNPFISTYASYRTVFKLPHISVSFIVNFRINFFDIL